MTHNEVRNAILTAFLSMWGTTTLVAHDNQQFSPPDDRTPWIRHNIRFMDGWQASIGDPGNNLFRNTGMVVVQVFTPVGDFTYNNDVYCQTIYNHYKGNVSITGVRFSSTRIVTWGPEVGKVWYRQDVDVDFQFDDLG